MLSNEISEILSNLELLDNEQTTKIAENQAENNEGSHVWKISDESKVRRFLIFGTTGGSFYSFEKELTIEDAKSLLNLIDAGKGSMIIKEICLISLDGRAPKLNPTLFALALCARYKVADGIESYLRKLHQEAFRLMPLVCRIPAHLFTFVDYCQKISAATGKATKSTGWGVSMRKSIASWYLNGEKELLAMHLTKCPKRLGWSHRDLLRLSHPSTNDTDRNLLFRYAVKKDRPLKRPADEQVETVENRSSKALKLVDAVTQLRSLDTKDDMQAAELINNCGLVKEHVPTHLLASATVWKALLTKMSMTTLVANLSKMTALGLLENDDSVNTKLVVNKLGDRAQLKQARLHPLDMLLASSTYRAGGSRLSKWTWQPTTVIVDALENAVQLAFDDVQPTGLRFCLALDVSASMDAKIAGSILSCREAAAALSLVTLRTEQYVDVVTFGHQLTELTFDKTWTVEQACECTNKVPYGPTDCALPMIWSCEQKKPIDVFVVYTASNTNFGTTHPSEALRRYRDEMNIARARLIVVGLVADQFTIADPDDPGMLDMVGFDPAIVTVMHDFVTDRI